MNTNATPVTTATIPYIKRTSETIARILEPYKIRIAHKPITTLQQLLTNVKDKDEPSDRRGAVYKIKCCDCQATDIGETGRNLNVRLTGHKRVTRNGDINNHIAEHNTTRYSATLFGRNRPTNFRLSGTLRVSLGNARKTVAL